ncbi:MAG: LytTR family DNA-binding domain-containing protein [Lachnospiraceae bacterium]|nr:LytTR family DNA-binding domain-containing protein [Lachnospiraceae bacterium]
MLNIAVCDGKEEILHHISTLVSGEFKRRGISIHLYGFMSGKELLYADEQNPFHVVFLDIFMADFDGRQIADIMRKRRERVKIIFVTGHADLVFDSFSCQPYAFIVKEDSGLMKKRFSQVVSRIELEESQKKAIVLKDINIGKQTVFCQDIVVIESDRNYLEYMVQHYKDALRVRGTITKVEELLSPHYFIRVHRKNIVNMIHILYIDQKKQVIVMDNGTNIIMGGSYRRSVMDMYQRYLAMKGGIMGRNNT